MQKIILKDENGNRFTWFKQDDETDMCIELLVASGKYGLPDRIEITRSEMTEEQIIAWQYLLDTDWYTARKIDSNTDIPAVVVEARLEARSIL